VEEIKAKNFDLKAVNPNRKGTKDHRTPEELLAIIESQAAEIAKALTTLRNRII
jgi:type I restriction enzyme M protein